MSALVVNLYGAPGAGKSTTRADVFRQLKNAGVNCEEVYEHAKKLTWSSRHGELACQPYIFGKQLRDMEVLLPQVEVIVTDSPLLLSVFYARKYRAGVYPASYEAFIVDYTRQIGGINFYLRRTKAYNPKGRNQTAEESDAIGLELKMLLDEFAFDYRALDGSPEAATIIAETILSLIRK